MLGYDFHLDKLQYPSICNHLGSPWFWEGFFTSGPAGRKNGVFVLDSLFNSAYNSSLRIYNKIMYYAGNEREVFVYFMRIAEFISW